MNAPTQPITGAPGPISFWQAFRFWLKLGFISFGGPAGQIAILHQELVENRRWISERRFLHALNYCMLLPGPEAQQLATYLGWLMHRTWGGIVAGALFVLPSLAILIGLSWIYFAFGETTIVSGLFYGIKPAVAAIVIQATYRIGTRALKNKWLWIIAADAFVAIFWLNAPFPLIIATAALVGFIGGRLAPHVFQTSSGHGGANKRWGAALIDDDTPAPEHARFRWSRLFAVMAWGSVLWALPMGLLTRFWGWEHTFTQMGWFFTKAALLTFGGAYAVLPYVVQGAVNQYAWVTPTQMMDGAIAACLVTWFTFLPSFLFIFAGGPFIESTHNNLNLTAPLTAITAAVVGVILNLALFFGQHVFWPQGFGGTIDVVAAAIALGAAIALFGFKRSVIQVVVACAVAGLAIKALTLGDFGL